MNTKKSYSTDNTYSIISYDEYVDINSTSKQFTSTSNYYVHQTTPPTIYKEIHRSIITSIEYFSYELSMVCVCVCNDLLT